MAVVAENVRLVIWDLDDTFWSGTLAEEGMVYNRQHHDAVIELARRGIPSSICSKNDHDRVKAILEAEGLWDYFIFPSISWDAKGPRLQAIVDAVQLRPPTILFVDDNEMNLNEARHYLPELQLADEKILPGLLDNPLLQGKPDPELTRLKQYKLLETRQQAMASTTGDNHEFLRASGLRVEIIHDIEPQIDRAVELINRTNQLNFTKNRLPEDPASARNALRELINRYDIQAGLIHARDRYGDYGLCGFYALRSGAAGRSLVHYCFSCRILNLGVETWLFRRFGAPRLDVVGEVLTDLTDDAPIDWINAETPDQAQAESSGIDRLFARGGCNLAAITHYFGIDTGHLVGEFNIDRSGVDVRRDHSLFLRYALDPDLSAADRAELERFGFLPEDYKSALFSESTDDSVWLLSFWADADFQVYRHKTTGLLIPFFIPVPGKYGDLRQVSDAEIPARFHDSWVMPALAALRAEYDHVGLIAKDVFQDNLRRALDRAPARGRVFILGNNEVRIDQASGQRHDMFWKRGSNDSAREVAAEYPQVEFMDVAQFITVDGEIGGDPNHFDRQVYFRVFQHIKTRLAKV